MHIASPWAQVSTLFCCILPETYCQNHLLLMEAIFLLLKEKIQDVTHSSDLLPSKSLLLLFVIASYLKTVLHLFTTTMHECNIRQNYNLAEWNVCFSSRYVYRRKNASDRLQPAFTPTYVHKKHSFLYTTII